MTRRNMWLGAGAVVIIAVIIVLAVTHKSTKPSTTSSSTGYSSQSSASTSNTPTNTTPSAVVATKTDSAHGQYLVDASGQPLYTYGGDSSGTSNCTGACLVNWPIYEATSSSTSLPTNVTTITRSDGKVQYAYKGLPLYYFSSDSGSTPTGDGVGDFHLAKP